MQQNKWNLTPWVRRRIERHIERGSSARVVQCLLDGVPGQRMSASNPAHTTMPLPLAENVILFKDRRLVA